MAADPLEIICRQERLAAARAPFEAQWQEVAELVRPIEANFFGSPGSLAVGRRLNQQTYDSTPAVAADNLAASLWGGITNSANEWFQLKHQDDALNEVEEVKTWLGDCGKTMRNAFAARGGMFYARVIEVYQDTVCFGHSNHYVEEQVGQRRIRFARRPVAECFAAENSDDEVDSNFRKFSYTARQAVQRWGARVSQKVAETAAKDPDRSFEFIHAVYPREDYKPGASLAPEGKRFASCWVELEGKKLLAESGYAMFPYQVPRWSRAATGTYGYGPAMLALADMKTLQAQNKTSLIAAQKAADPPILAPDEFAARGVRTSPGGYMYGGMDSMGNQLLKPFISGARVEITLEMLEQRRQAIKDAFLFSLLMLVGMPNRTATEVLAQQEEKIRLMGPYLGRLQAELLDPLIDLVFDIMFRAGAFPPPPEILLQYPGIRIDYVSPLARAQKAAEGASIVRTLEASAPIGAIKPEIYDNLDGDKTFRTLADAFGMSSKLLVDPRTVAKIRQQRQQMQQMQLAAQMAQPAQQAAGAVKALADAGASARGAQA